MNYSKLESLTIIQSTLFSSFKNVNFGLSTRPCGVSAALYGLNLSFKVGDSEQHVQTNRELFFGRLNISLDRIAFPKQVHGNKVMFANKPGVYDDCDGLITDKTNLYLAISVADCLPIFLYDSVNKIFAAIHSGWKGSKLRILSSAVQMMTQHFNSNPENIYAFMGQSAGVCCYEVGEEVATQFSEEFVDRPPGKKPHLNLKEYNKDILLREGFNKEHIEISSHCTICDSRLFHSFRRDGNNSGRMMGVIGLKK